MTCKNCGYENRLGVRYCQRCGQYIEPKRTLAQEVKSWDFRSLAGVGRRDVNIAAMKTGWVFDIASGVVSILNQNGRWHKKLSRGILEALLALDAEM